MAFEVILHLNFILLLSPLFIDKDCFKILSEEVCVGGQVKLKISVEKDISFTKLSPVPSYSCSQ